MTSIKLKKQKVNVLFIAVDADSFRIIGFKISENLNLIKQIYKITYDVPAQGNIEDKFSGWFGEIGFLRRTHHIDIKGYESGYHSYMKNNNCSQNHAERRIPAYCQA